MAFNAKVTGLLAGALFLASTASHAYTLDTFTTQYGLFDVNSSTAYTGASGSSFNIPLSNFEASVASNASIPGSSAYDTMSFHVKADPGKVITNISFQEGGSLNISLGSGGFAIVMANGSIVADGAPAQNPFSTVINTLNGSYSWQDPQSGPAFFAYSISDNKTDVLVTITNSLFAAATGGSSASISKDLASVSVTTSPVPLPPAAWLFGSALVGLVSLSRRRREG
jgi:hypothetical protein